MKTAYVNDDCPRLKEVVGTIGHVYGTAHCTGCDKMCSLVSFTEDPEDEIHSGEEVILMTIKEMF